MLELTTFIPVLWTLAAALVGSWTFSQGQFASLPETIRGGCYFSGIVGGAYFFHLIGA